MAQPDREPINELQCPNEEVHGPGTHCCKLVAYELHGHADEVTLIDEVHGMLTHVSWLETYELHGHEVMV
jgi:hypothetical protein